jgi:CheY-like chemotaxis protein
LLSAQGYEVRTATNADEALAVIDEQVPQLILMDIQLPGMDGLTLTRKLKEDPRTRDTFIVAVTAYAMKGDEQRAREAGCDAYITKPIDTRALPAMIDEYLAGSTASSRTAATDVQSAPSQTQSERDRMTGPAILLVEDNPITRKLVRFTLESQGLVVIDAPDAKTALEIFSRQPIALVLQDICLPDMNGFELVGLLRALPGGAEVPILAFSGMLSQHDEGRISAAGFDDLISKPVEPSRLLEIVRTYLPAEETPADSFGQGRRVVVADDDPVQRKLVAFRIQKVGFSVVAAADGNEALDLVRRTPPDAVVSDVLMPGLDGFALCMEIRRDPALADIPVVLTTSSYVEPTDRDLARKAGAHDLVPRTPDLREVLEALRVSLGSAPPAIEEAATAVELEREHMRRVMRQLERQVALNTGANQRCALLSLEISVLKGISEALASHEAIDDALRHALAACFDAGGISFGALYLKEETGLRILSFGFSKDWSDTEVLAFFGERSLLDVAMGSQKTLALPSGAGAAGRRLLTRAAASTALIVPIGYKGLSFGALLMLSKNRDLESDDRIKFAEAVGGQISQSLAVAHAFREQKGSERAAREQAAVLRSILESIGDAVIVADSEGNLIHRNPAATRMMKGTGDVQPRELRARLSIENWSTAYEIYGSDKSTPIAFEQFPLVRAMRGESVDGVELFMREEEAAEGVWLSGSGRPWRDDKGHIRGGVAVFRDITQEKAIEAQLLQSQKMEAVGLLAGGIAHDFNNQLFVISGYSDLLARKVAERQDLLPLVREIREAGARATMLTRQLLAFSRKQIVEPKVVNLNAHLFEIEKMLRPLIGEHIDLTILPGTDLGAVKIDPGQLDQVIMNLAVNARDAMLGGGKLTISTSNAELDEAYARSRAGVVPGSYVLLTVSDTGTGMDQAVLSRIFEPFFTTKGIGKGTGLGLPTVQAIVAQSDGHIVVESDLGRGTIFKIYLPRAEESARIPEADEQEAELPRGSGTVLLVEDEPAIRALVRTTLEQQGYTVLTAQDGAAALTVAEQFIGTIDVLVTDVVMPSMGGRALADQLLSQRPGLKIIYMSGHTDDIMVLHGVLANNVTFLPKPCPLDRLLRSVQEVLSGGS